MQAQEAGNGKQETEEGLPHLRSSPGEEIQAPSPKGRDGVGVGFFGFLFPGSCFLPRQGRLYFEKNSQMSAEASTSEVTLPSRTSCAFGPPGQQWPPPSMR